MARLRRAALAALLAMVFGTPPVGAHGGVDQPIRPVVTGVEPKVGGVRAEVVYTGAWQLRLSNASGIQLEVQDQGGRPFLRIGPGGTMADFSSPKWYESNSPDGIGRAPADLPGGGPDFRQVAAGASWAWFDSRLRVSPGAIPPEVRASAKGTRLATWEVPLRHGERRGRVHGYLEYEPVLGAYRHALVSTDSPAPGVTVGLVAAGAIPAMRIENAGRQPVILIGKAGEPFARIGADAEVNLRSPTWLEIAQSGGQVPTIAADAAAEPLWRLVGSGPRWSWPEFRGRPPDSEPSSKVAGAAGPAVVKRWSVPLQVADRRVEVEGLTEFVPAPPGGHGPGWLSLAGLGLAGIALAFLVHLYLNRRPSNGGGTPARQRGRASAP